MIAEHEHPLNLIDMWSKQLQHEEESEEEDEEANVDEFITKQDFQRLCSRCDEEINWFHRYYYTCCQCEYSLHKFCAELQEEYKDIRHPHLLYFLKKRNYPYDSWKCDICHNYYGPGDLYYRCSQCYFDVDVKCAIKRQQINIIHHPSHEHPLVRIPKNLLGECDACGMKHEGLFYHCTMCDGPFIHSHCAFLLKKLQIQHYTNDFFSHIHPLELSYTFAKADQISKFYPPCRVCRQAFPKEYLWIYKCEKCRYYTHLDCATARNEPFMSILASPGIGKTIKNYEDAEHPNLLHLPFPDPSYSLLKHLFFKENGSSTCKTHDISHQHPLILEDARCSDITIPSSSRIKSISYHDPMKRIQPLCDGCVRPITSGPIYVCANEEEEHCNFVLHEWCSRLPAELIDHPAHQQHTLTLHSKAPGKFFGVFYCKICWQDCNGFAYCCMDCKGYVIDVECALLPKEITHTSHPNHVLSRVYQSGYTCSMCEYTELWNCLSFSCHTCNDFQLHAKCALLIPKTTTHKCDKHPMKLSYVPIENHKSDYFCEVCEGELNPEHPFYHCRDCMKSMHTACAPSILRYETYTTRGTFYAYENVIHQFINVKFGATYENIKVHPHPLSFVQGIEDDGECAANVCVCYYGIRSLQYSMIFKCLDCKFAIHYDCCERVGK